MTQQLMRVGQGVRSTPMHWALEGKRLDAVVKYMSWLPPRARRPGDGEAAGPVLGGNRVVEDKVGRGRSPAIWFTVNCGWRGYNALVRA